MSDDDAPSHFVRDILTGTPEWRWAGPHPALKVAVKIGTGLHFIAEFTVADATFKSTGPVTINFLVNGKSIGSERYSSPGMYSFDKAVEDGTVLPGKDAELSLDVDKYWTSPVDGAKLAVILSKIGLRQQ